VTSEVLGRHLTQNTDSIALLPFQWFYDKELTFALSITVAIACVAKTLAKASVAPVAEHGGFESALWYAAGMQVVQ
jgi:hypothetical protein